MEARIREDIDWIVLLRMKKEEWRGLRMNEKVNQRDQVRRSGKVISPGKGGGKTASRRV